MCINVDHIVVDEETTGEDTRENPKLSQLGVYYPQMEPRIMKNLRPHGSATVSMNLLDSPDMSPGRRKLDGWSTCIRFVTMIRGCLWAMMEGDQC